jgi:putative transposase
MTEEQKQRVAVFRFGIIHDLVSSARLDHGEQEELLVGPDNILSRIM